MNNRLILFLSLFANLAIVSQAQNKNDNDTRSANRRFADSLYEARKQLSVSLTNQTDIDTVQKRQVKKRIKLQSDSLCVEATETATFTNQKNIPSSTLYLDTWCTNKVKMPNFRFGELPDEIIIRLTDRRKQSKFHFPYKGVKTSSYGWRWGRPHTGIDFALNIGDKIHAVFDGVVRVAQTNGGYGKMVLIRHYNNLESLYAHLDDIKVSVGQQVKAGDVIGLGGNTGNSTGPHLHFEFRFLYECFDPEFILDIANFDIKRDVIKIEKTFFGIDRQEKYQKKNPMTSLVKVNKTFEGKPYYPYKDKYGKQVPSSKLLAHGGGLVEINNEDKRTWRYYVVKKNDSITKIAERFNVTALQIKQMNELKDDELKENTRIRVR